MSKLNRYDLPELPLEKILGYLSLADRIKARAVSRRWCKTIDSFKVKRLCFSDFPSGFILEKRRWISDEFVQSFIHSTKFELFFQTYGQSILSNLKHLRLCDLRLDAESLPAHRFAQTLNSFSQLEELDIIRLDQDFCHYESSEAQLNLPMLNSIQLQSVSVTAIDKLTLDAPKLRNVKWMASSEALPKNSRALELDIVHGESVELLMINSIRDMEVAKLKNLKYLYTKILSNTESTLLILSYLEQLEEIHLCECNLTLKLYEHQLRRVDLKVFVSGLLLVGPNDPVIDWFGWVNNPPIGTLAKHPTRLANEIPLINLGFYEIIESVSESEIGIVKRFTDLSVILVDRPIEDIPRFLNLLNNWSNITGLWLICHQSQDLLYDLPDYSPVQWLSISCNIRNPQVLFGLKDLCHLRICWSVDAEFIRKAYEELPFLLLFEFEFINKSVIVKTGHQHSYFVSVEKGELDEEKRKVPDLESAIQFIIKKTSPRPKLIQSKVRPGNLGLF